MTSHGDVHDTLRRLEGEGLLDESPEDIYEQAPVGYLSSLTDGTIVKVNQTLLDWTGYARDELVGAKRLHDLLAPGARIYYETHYAPLLLMQGEVREIAVEVVRADRSRLPVLMNSSLLRNDDGAPAVIRTTIFDASERRRYERELLRARAEAELRARAAVAVAHVAEGIVLVGERGDVELMNPSAELILGVSSAAAVGRRAEDAIAGWSTIVEHTAVARAGERPAPGVVPVMRERGEQWLAVSAVDAGDATVYTVRDVTSERDVEQFRSDVIAIVSHELRTPLTGVYGAAQTVLTRYDTLDDDVRRQLLEMVVTQAGRLTRILDQILLTSRIDAGALEANVEPFDASEVLDTLLGGLEDSLRGRVVVDVREGATVRADLDRLRQVVSNLLDNALKYSSGAVRVGLEVREVTARFTVADDGPGIPAGEHERVFEKFFRLDPSQQRGVGGTGLGLYVARELVHRMGGRIGFLPRENGTTVFVDVPLALGR